MSYKIDYGRSCIYGIGAFISSQLVFILILFLGVMLNKSKEFIYSYYPLVTVFGAAFSILLFLTGLMSLKMEKSK